MSAISVFGPDFPFAYDDWLAHRDGLGELPVASRGQRVAIVGAGLSGLVAAFELMRIGLRPVLYEAGRMGGRLRSQEFENAPGIVAELGGMRFPASATTFNHYVNLTGLKTQPFPNPLTPAAGSTVVDIAGEPVYANTLDDLPEIYKQVALAWQQSLNVDAQFEPLQQAIKDRDVKRIKALWDPLVRDWDERTFYDFLANSDAFRRLSFRHKEIFGQVGFGTGGWDSDFKNTMLEILRVVLTDCDSSQSLIVGGAEQLPRRLWEHQVKPNLASSTISLSDLNNGAPRGAVTHIKRAPDMSLQVSDQYGNVDHFDAVLVTCQSWLLTTSIKTDEQLFSQAHWMALDRTSYMQSSKTFVMVDRPFWKDKQDQSNRDVMSMTLTDRLTRGTYLFDNGPDKPAVICLTYSWNADALKMLPLNAIRRADLALDALSQIYPTVNIRSHIIGKPITISWESDPNFLGAFKGALPGHYRYNRRMYTHFMQQHMPVEQQGIFIAGDDVSWTPGWAEGAVQTALNAVWGIVRHFGGRSAASNPGPGDLFDACKPLDLEDGDAH